MSILKMKSVDKNYLNLGLLCLIVFAMASLRAIYSGTLTNLFVYWNVFLAIAAFGFIKLFNKLNQNLKLKAHLKNLGLVAIFLGWLSLVPNAIYLVTDLGHLNSAKIYQGSRIVNKEKNNYRSKREIPYIYDVVLLFLLSLIGFISSGMLTNQMFGSLKKSDLQRYLKLNSKTEFIYLGLVGMGSAVAVFLGRYLRWNSWDLIINPVHILKDLSYYFTHPLATPNLYLIIVLFFILVTVAHLMFKSDDEKIKLS